MGLVYLPTFKNHRFMANLGQYPSPMDPMGLWVIGINLAVNESTAKTTRFSGWQVIPTSSRGPTSPCWVRIYASRIPNTARWSRFNGNPGWRSWKVWHVESCGKKTNTSCWNDLVILIGFLLSWWTLISNSKGSMGWLYIYLHENHPNSSIYAGYITIPYPWILWEWYLLGGGFKYLLPDPWHRMIR